MDVETGFYTPFELCVRILYNVQKNYVRDSSAFKIKSQNNTCVCVRLVLSLWKRRFHIVSAPLTQNAEQSKSNKEQNKTTKKLSRGD